MARSMTNAPLYGPRVNYTSSDAQRQQMLAQQLLREGASTRPAEGGIGEVLARIGTAGLGGLFSGQAQGTEDAYKAERAKTLAEALAAGQGTPAAPPPTLAAGEAAATRGTGVASQPTQGDPQRMAAILMGNPQTADMGAQLALGQMQYKQQRADTQADRQDERSYQTGVRKEERGYRLEDLYLNQNFQKEMQALSAAQASGNAEAARKHATELQRLQQEFMKGENQLNRDATLTAAKTKAESEAAGKTFDRSNTLRDEYSNLTKDYRTVTDAYSKIKGSAQTGAGDMAMLYNFVKLLDPGSVVRESEFATAAASGSYGERIQGLVQRVLTGQRLPDSLRSDFMAEADNVYKSQQAGAEKIKTQYRDLAGRYNLKPEDVIVDYQATTPPPSKDDPLGLRK